MRFYTIRTICLVYISALLLNVCTEKVNESEDVPDINLLKDSIHNDDILDNSDSLLYDEIVIFDSNQDIVWSLDESISDIDESDAYESDNYCFDAKYDNDIDINDEDKTTPCKLIDSGPVKVTRNGQIIEGLRIYSENGAAVIVEGFSDVIIRNCEIYHSMGQGITFSKADRIKIENVSVTFNNSPISGPNPSSEYVNINGYSSADVIIEKVRLIRGSSGIYLLECPNAKLREIEGYDFRGPFPRGQLVQFDKSNNSILEDFSVINNPNSWPEDNINIYKSTNVIVKRGYIDGNNSPSGVGVIFDGDTSTGTVEDVDAIRMGNGCFSAYAGDDGSIFRRTRCRENICTDQGRGPPSSGGLMWAGKIGLNKLKIEESEYYKPCNPSNIVWPEESFEKIELKKNNFTMRSPIKLKFCWE